MAKSDLFVLCVLIDNLVVVTQGGKVVGVGIALSTPLDRNEFARSDAIIQLEPCKSVCGVIIQQL